MRAALTLLSVLLALAIVGVLVKRQWGAIGHPPVPTLPASATGDAGAAPSAPAAVRTPGQQVQHSQQTVEGVMQQPRALPDDAQKAPWQRTACAAVPQHCRVKIQAKTASSPCWVCASSYQNNA